MSEIAIQRFLNELAELKHRSGKPNESSIRLAFIKLLGDYAKAKDHSLVLEVSVKGKLEKSVTPDGTLKDTLKMTRHSPKKVMEQNRIYHINMGIQYRMSIELLSQ